jgi:predicted dehydrogenase
MIAQLIDALPEGIVPPRHALICGLGSIGRRHLRHLRALGVERIDAWRTGKATLPDFGQPMPDHVYGTLEESLDQGPDIVIVANPSSLHLETARAAIQSGCHVLVEKPFTHTMDGVDAFQKATHESGAVVAVGCNMRFHPLLRVARSYVEAKDKDLGDALHCRIHFHANIPDWHPWEDFRSSYVARADMGGGAALTHIHEIDYALWLFGPAPRARVMASPLHPLSTDVDEITSILLGHSSGVQTHISLSLCATPPSRGFEIVFANGTLRVDLLAGTCHLHRPAQPAEVVGSASIGDVDDTYRLQLINFVAAIHGVPNAMVVGVDDAIQAVRIALLAKEHDDVSRSPV